MLISEIIGQAEVKGRLLKMVSENRIPHALLFSGPEGCGNLAAAVAFSQLVLCRDKKANDACAVCPSCLKVTKLIHPDLHFVFPFAKNKETPNVQSVMADFRSAFLENPYMSAAEWFNEL